MGEGRIDMKRYSWIFGALLVLTSCTGDFKDINTDLSGITDEDLQIDYNEHGIRLGVNSAPLIVLDDNNDFVGFIDYRDCMI